MNSSTLEPDILCKACSYKTPSADGLFVPVEWRENSSSNGQNTYRPCYNFCPTFYGPVLLSKKLLDPTASVDERVIQPMMWGLVPKWFRVCINLEILFVCCLYAWQFINSSVWFTAKLRVTLLLNMDWAQTTVALKEFWRRKCSVIPC